MIAEDAASEPLVQGVNIPPFNYQWQGASSHPLSSTIGTGNLLPLSQLDQLSHEFPGEEHTSPWRASFASLSDPSDPPPSRDLFRSHLQCGSLIRAPDGYWLLEVSPAAFCRLPIGTAESLLLVLSVPTSIAETLAPPKRHPLPSLPPLLACPIHLGGQVTHLHQETSFTLTLTGLSTVATLWNSTLRAFVCC
jgi:hypothetical protein